jgi:CheY-like chemotaxis protein
MRHHILTIDDEPAIREMLREALEVAGFRVTDVATAVEAMDVIRRDPPQLVITDLQLEETDGFVAIEQIKAEIPAVPVILLTGVLMEGDAVDRGVAGKIAGYIPKTAPLSHIVGEVKRCLR